VSGLPWFRFFPSDWLGGTRGLSATETGVYITLVAMMYDRGSPIPTNMPRLAQQCGTSPARFGKAVDTLLSSAKIFLLDDGYWNQRVQKETELVSKTKTNASTAANQRWEKEKQNQRPVSNGAMPEQCDRNANQKPDTRYQKDTPAASIEASPPKGDRTPAKRGSRVDDFIPDILVATEMGMAEATARFESEQFLDYWRGVPGAKGVKLDWPATWRNRVREQIQRNGSGHRAPANRSRPPPPNVPSASHGFRALEELQADIRRSRNEPDTFDHEDGGKILGFEPRYRAL
jgi:uncharacterized protein YdaU (DUF1376 family)